MSLGQTTSAPASTCETAVRAISSSDASLSTSPSRPTTPQWPCEVYSHRHTSVISSSSGKRGRNARSACCTIPSSIHAPEPSSSFDSGQPEEDHRRHAEAHELFALVHDRVDGVPRQSRQPLVRQRLGRDEERHHEVVDGERRLAHEIAQRAGSAQAAQTGDGERAHGCSRVRGSDQLDLDRDAVLCHGSSVIRSAKNSQIARPTASSGSAISAPGSP